MLKSVLRNLLPVCSLELRVFVTKARAGSPVNRKGALWQEPKFQSRDLVIFVAKQVSASQLFSATANPVPGRAAMSQQQQCQPVSCARDGPTSSNCGSHSNGVQKPSSRHGSLVQSLFNRQLGRSVGESVFHFTCLLHLYSQLVVLCCLPLPDAASFSSFLLQFMSLPVPQPCALPSAVSTPTHTPPLATRIWGRHFPCASPHGPHTHTWWRCLTRTAMCRSSTQTAAQRQTERTTRT